MKKPLLALAVLFVLFIPAISFAAGIAGPLVQDPTVAGPNTGGAAYTLCDLRVLANNIIDFAVVLSVFVATLMFAYGGILYVTGPAGGEAQIKKAHSVLLNAVVGILIVLLAWLIINIVLSVLTGQGATFWTQFTCEANPQSGAFSANSNIPTFPAAITPGSTNTNVPAVNPKDNLTGVNSDLVKLVNAAHGCSSVPFVVTSGFRESSATACNSRHLYGDAVDVHPLINGVVDMKNDGSTRVAPNATYMAIDQAFQCASKQTGIPFDWGGSSATFMKYGYDSEHFQLPRSSYPDNGSQNQCH